MRRFLLAAAFLSVSLVPAKGQPGGAGFGAPGPVRLLSTSEKVAQSDAVVTGKVTNIEKEPVELEANPGDKKKTAFTVAVIKVETNIAGAKNVTHIKVVFAANPAQTDAEDQIRRLGRIRPGLAPIALTEGQEGVFFLQKRPGADSYYSIQPMCAPLPAAAENYKAELTQLKAISEAIADPVKALKAEKIDQRLASAKVIVTRYHQRPRAGEVVEEAIPAQETKLIMKALLDAAWTNEQTDGPTLAYLIGLEPGRNGVPVFVPKPGEDYNALWKTTVKAWYEKAGDTFEIKKFVPKK